MITLPAPRLSPKYTAFLREFQDMPQIVAGDEDERNVLAAAFRALWEVPKNGGQLSTECAVDVLVMLVRAPDCERREVEIKKLIEQLAKAKPKVSVYDTHRIFGAFQNAQDRGKGLKRLQTMYLEHSRKHLRAMYLKSRRSK